MKQKTSTGLEPVLGNETDFMSVALTTQPKCLIYYALVAHWKPETGVVSRLRSPDTKNQQKTGKRPEGPDLDKLL